MTGNQILHADVLDILFENRNKLYGAYHLRKTYHQRLLQALLFSFAVIFLFLFLLSLKGKENILPKSKTLDDGIIVRTIDHAPPPIETPPPQQATAPAAPAAAQVQYNQIKIVSHAATDANVPPQDVISRSVIADVTTPGAAHAQFVPPAENGPGTGVAAEAPAPATTAVHSYAAPEFPGGAAAWMRFLNRHLRAPDGLALGEKKSVVIQFLVSADGSITQFDVLQSGGAQFDNEVIRVLKKMPKWKPALQNGKPVSKTFTQPVTFVQQEE